MRPSCSMQQTTACNIANPPTNKQTESQPAVRLSSVVAAAQLSSPYLANLRMMSMRSLKTLPGWRISRTCVLHRNRHERAQDIMRAHARTHNCTHSHARTHARTRRTERAALVLRAGAQWVTIDERHDDSMARHVDGLRHGEAVLVQRLPAEEP